MYFKATKDPYALSCLSSSFVTVWSVGWPEDHVADSAKAFHSTKTSSFLKYIYGISADSSTWK